jgi:alkyl sulfatase BDS1-like metallo-beta-lactamase superfamily hydrolase
VADLLGLSARLIDEGITDEPSNRVTTELSEVADGIAVIEAFSHVVAFRSEAGLVLFDTSLEVFAEGILKSLRGWTEDPVHTVAYTHGHVDHVGGARSILDDAAVRGGPAVQVIAHENVPPRFARYALTDGYNRTINARQFGGGRVGAGMLGAAERRFGPSSWVQPDTTFRDRLRVRVGGLEIEYRHARGETDDHLWAWLPGRRAICAGDFVTWVFPNAGNPQKVQRYPLEWAAALREMAGLGAELLLPAHGLPVAGVERVRRVLDDLASGLESLVRQTLELMNQGARLDTILHTVSLPQELLHRPYMRPIYDEPEFVVRNVWRQYGGWYDGNPAHLKPAPDRALARELATLVGGAAALVERARALSESGEERVACQLIELATQAEPSSREAHAARREIYERRRGSELSLMARGIYGWAARESARIADGEGES